MVKYERRRAATEFNGETATNAGATLSEAGSARRSFLGRIGRWSGALAMLGLGGEIWQQAFSERSVISSAVAGGDSGSLPPPTLLFASNFQGDVQFTAPYGCGSTSCLQDIAGTDPSTGFDFTGLSIFNGGYRGHLITGESGTNAGNIGEYHDNQVLTTTGPHGNQTRAARFRTLQNTRGDNQNVFGYFADQRTHPERLYFKYWLRMEPDLAEKMGPNGWISFWAWKTSGGDYRLTSQIWTDSNSVPFWSIQGDNEANANRPYERYFRVQNRSVPVPQGEWFKVEVFYDRNGRGRAWQAINGVVVFDYTPPEGQDLYGVDNGRIRQGTFLTVRAAVPRTREVWLDEFEIWDNFPPASSNPPALPQSPGAIEVTQSRRLGATA